MNGFRLIADRLGYGYDPDPMLGELAKIEFLFECLAEEPAIAMHNDKIERVLTVTGALDHLLEYRSAIITGGGAWLNELSNDSMALGSAP
jgi:hypothetical protein